MASMKTTRTGFDSEKDRVRRDYTHARAGGVDHDRARKMSAKGLPFHMVDGWVEDLRSTFDGDDAMEQTAAYFQYGGQIVRRRYA